MINRFLWLEHLRSQRSRIVTTILRHMYQSDFHLMDDETHLQATNDANFHLDNLFTSIEIESQALFNAYAQWAAELMTHPNSSFITPTDFFEVVMEVLLQEVDDIHFTTAHYQRIKEIISQGFAHMKSNTGSASAAEAPATPLQDELTRYTRHLLASDRSGAAKLVQQLLQNGVDVKDLYRHLFHPFQIELGRLWQANKINVAQEHFATAATQYIMSLLYDHILSLPKGDKVFLATCVSGELHEMGIRMVCDYLECLHWNTHYLGANMPESAVIQAVMENQPDVIAISCTMMYHIPKASHLIQRLRKADIPIPILVGGYPFNIDPLLWHKTGANGTAGSFDAIYDTIETLTGGEVLEI
ncbi:cobalamin B12-binding domain-containing protein [Anoxynatronum buryatiense]|uniref:Methanogenic corrinoid protein MtbC1 n=1 Tax=Anoxynatronum buryatiense TaxID=489973 RepID=A0AA45WYZ4_9CLOT|nr:cobalamin-dependent protein [Anoxynatronum buryatiense]SMP69198.1 Methanogenic corrinoid protein MtbC1 [Anoxynatronum buryatiense]